jgi:glutaredoxin
MNKTLEISVYGEDWCWDTIRAKRLLDQHEIPYRWVDIGRDKEGETLVLNLNHGNRSIPTIIFSDGTTLVEPSNSDLAKKMKRKDPKSR